MRRSTPFWPRRISIGQHKKNFFLLFIEQMLPWIGWCLVVFGCE